MSIASETLDNIEKADWLTWMVRQFYAANIDCIDISKAAGQDDKIDLALRADNLAYRLRATCALKHGSTTLAQFAMTY